MVREASKTRSAQNSIPKCKTGMHTQVYLTTVVLVTNALFASPPIPPPTAGFPLIANAQHHGGFADCFPPLLPSQLKLSSCLPRLVRVNIPGRSKRRSWWDGGPTHSGKEVDLLQGGPSPFRAETSPGDFRMPLVFSSTLLCRR